MWPSQLDDASSPLGGSYREEKKFYRIPLGSPIVSKLAKTLRNQII